MIKKPLVLSAAAILLLIVAFVVAVAPPRYTAVAMVQATPYTNALFTSQFITNASHCAPYIFGIYVRPFARQLSPGMRAKDLTNCASIYIRTQAPTAQQAQSAANDAATNLCQIIRTQYGVNAWAALPAKRARKWSLLVDVFIPPIHSLFNRSK
jgi:hypothetical protein